MKTDKFRIGVAWYPEHVDESKWESDLQLFAAAGLNTVRCFEFAWCRLEPREGVFDFAWCDRAIALARKHGIGVMACTPTEAPPPWLLKKYPDMLPVDRQGLPTGSGGRRHGNHNHPGFLQACDRITDAMAAHFCANDNVVAWQLDNEAGCHLKGQSYGPHDLAAFREWCRRKYGSVREVNRAWGLVFWSQELTDWNELRLHVNPLAGTNPGYENAVYHFQSDAWIEFLHRQARIIRKHLARTGLTQRISHNVTWYAEQVNAFQLFAGLDAAGIDLYQRRPEMMTMVSDLYRSIGNISGPGPQPFWVMEMGVGETVRATPDGPYVDESQFWRRMVKYLFSGAEYCSMFRDRPSPFGQEMGLGAGLITSDERPGTAARVLGERHELLQQLHRELPEPREADAAILCDYTDFFQLSAVGVFDQVYWDAMCEWHRALVRAGFRMEFVTPDMPLARLRRFKLIVSAGKRSMTPEFAAKIADYVGDGGALVAASVWGETTPENARTCVALPAWATDLFGCRTDTYLHLPEKTPLAFEFDGSATPIACKALAVPLEQLTGEPIARFRGGNLTGRTAAVLNRYGDGSAVFIGTKPDASTMDELVNALLSRLGIPNQLPVESPLPPQGEIIRQGNVAAIFNHGHEPITLKPRGTWTEYASGQPVQTVRVPPFDLGLYRIH